MSILIKGMEMPKSCWRCPLCLTVDPDTYRCMPTGREFTSTFDAIDHIVLDCPLVEIPPHGDLIDRDELARQLGITDMECGKCALGNYGSCSKSREFVIVCEEIEYAPAIIPAEEGES